MYPHAMYVYIYRKCAVDAVPAYTALKLSINIVHLNTPVTFSLLVGVELIVLGSTAPAVLKY